MNLNQKVSILFRLNYSKQNARGLTPIWVRITQIISVRNFQHQHKVLPANWNVKREEVLDTDPEGDMINDNLLQLKLELKKHFNILLSTKNRATAAMNKRI